MQTCSFSFAVNIMLQTLIIDVDFHCLQKCSFPLAVNIMLQTLMIDVDFHCLQIYSFPFAVNIMLQTLIIDVDFHCFQTCSFRLAVNIMLQTFIIDVDVHCFQTWRHCLQTHYHNSVSHISIYTLMANFCLLYIQIGIHIHSHNLLGRVCHDTCRSNINVANPVSHCTSSWLVVSNQ